MKWETGRRLGERQRGKKKRERAETGAEEVPGRGYKYSTAAVKLQWGAGEPLWWVKLMEL